MTIHIEISDEIEQLLRRLATECGLSLDEYARRVLEKETSRGPLAAEDSGEGRGKPSRQNIIGKFAHLGLSVSREDIEEARREMWETFPREGPKPPQS
jgi:hypothetical protein